MAKAPRPLTEKVKSKSMAKRLDSMAEGRINDMIDEFATAFDDAGFLNALEMMAEYANTAKVARIEELDGDPRET